MPTTAAHKALHEAAIVERILRLLWDEQPDDDDYISHTSDRWREWTSFASTIRTFRLTVRHLLVETLFFGGGTKQLKRYFEAVGGSDELPPTKELVFFDQYPFKAKEEGGSDKAKWSFQAMKEVIEQVKGVESLEVLFFGQMNLPADLLKAKNLSNLKSLCLAAPLDVTSPKPLVLPFKLLRLELTDMYSARLDREAGWKRTARSLASSSQIRNSLRALHLDSFFGGFGFIDAFVPLAPNLTRLTIPPLTEGHRHPGLLDFLIFVQNCHSLTYLRFGLFHAEFPSILEDFPPASVKHLVLDEVRGQVGYGCPEIIDPEFVNGKDTWGNLIESLEKRNGVLILEIRLAKYMGKMRAIDLFDLCLEKGTHLYIESFYDELDFNQLQLMKELMEATEDRRLRELRLGWL